ncbi:MAG: radical SAM protein [Acidobacteriota bacterium]
MHARDVIGAWGAILSGRPPVLSIEVTRECPLRCPGCYAYEPDHIAGHAGLRTLADYKGDTLVTRALELIDRIRPLHVSLVGGDPLVRYREMEALVPQILARNIHVQLVTSLFRPPAPEWAAMQRLTIAVSIDGLPAEHDVRRAPATYERILKNIAGSRITIHSTITSQMVSRPGYLEEFVAFWSLRPEIQRIWFSIFTPQRGATDPEILSPAQRILAVQELTELRLRFPKLDMSPRMLPEFLKPPKSPDECIFSKVTETLSADLTSRVTPCQFGGDPDCSQCGCIASMGMSAIGHYKLGGIIPLGSIFKASVKVGQLRARGKRSTAPAVGAQPA